MRKEILFAIGAGLIFGLIIAFGVWRANKNIAQNAQPASPTAFESQKITNVKDNNQNIPTTEEVFLALTTPENMDVYTQNPVVVSGKSKQGAWITVSTEDEDFTLKTNLQGDFSQEIDLTPGINQVVITAFDDTGNWKSENLNLVFSSKFETKNE